jgi:hypothetical protein
MDKTRLLGLAILLPVIAYGWISAAASSGNDQAPASWASEYVYLHQTRNGASTLQKVTDRSPLQCVAD